MGKLEKKTVVLLAPTPPPFGGIASWTQRMLSVKMRNGWSIKVVDEKILGHREFFGDNTKRKIFLEIKRSFLIWNNLRKALKDSSVKVVHSCIPSSSLSMLREYVCACITHFYKRPFIMHFRCTVPVTAVSKMDRIILKLMCKKCDKFILLNMQSMEYMKHFTTAPAEIIPNFVDTKEISSQRFVRDLLKTAVYVGGVTEGKGCLDILTVASYFPDIEFRLIGNPEDVVMKAAEAIPNVILTGTQKKEIVQKELAEADIFIFLSQFRGEGFSNALAEAMAAGLPCVVSDWAANADMIEDKGGVVVSCNDVSSTIVAIESLMDKEVRQKCSDFNLNKIKKSYADNVVVNQYINCYEELLKEWGNESS